MNEFITLTPSCRVVLTPAKPRCTSLKRIDNFRAIQCCAGCPAMFLSSDSFGYCLPALSLGGVTEQRS